MTRRSINIIRTLQVPIKHGAENPITGARKKTITASKATAPLLIKASGSVAFTGALTSSAWPMTLAGIALTNSAGSIELYLPSTSSVSGASFYTFLAGSPAGPTMTTSASGSAAGLHAVIGASSSLGLTLGAYTAGGTSISITQSAGGTEGNRTITASGAGATPLSASFTGFGGGSYTTALKPSDSGATVFLGGTTAARVTLPAVASSLGVSYDFKTISVQQHIIQADAGTVFGCVHHNNDSAFNLTRIVFSGADRVRLHSSNAAIGDRIRMWCDGTRWYVDGLVNAAVD